MVRATLAKNERFVRRGASSSENAPPLLFSAQPTDRALAAREVMGNDSRVDSPPLREKRDS
jgi:hypothetical protein